MLLLGLTPQRFVLLPQCPQAAVQNLLYPRQKRLLAPPLDQLFKFRRRAVCIHGLRRTGLRQFLLIMHGVPSLSEGL